MLFLGENRSSLAQKKRKNYIGKGGEKHEGSDEPDIGGKDHIKL